MHKEYNISSSQFRINKSIRVPQVRLIDASGENVGVVSTEEAFRIAHEADCLQSDGLWQVLIRKN